MMATERKKNSLTYTDNKKNFINFIKSQQIHYSLQNSKKKFFKLPQTNDTKARTILKCSLQQSFNLHNIILTQT